MHNLCWCCKLLCSYGAVSVLKFVPMWLTGKVREFCFGRPVLLSLKRSQLRRWRREACRDVWYVFTPCTLHRLHGRRLRPLNAGYDWLIRSFRWIRPRNELRAGEFNGAFGLNSAANGRTIGRKFVGANSGNSIWRSVYRSKQGRRKFTDHGRLSDLSDRLTSLKFSRNNSITVVTFLK